MNRRGVFLGVLLLVLAFLLARFQESTAQDVDSMGRYKTVEVRTVQYIWELVSNSDGHVICQIILDHPNYPSVDETLTTCQSEIYPPEPTATSGTPAPSPTPTSTPVPGAVTPTPANTKEPFSTDNFLKGVSWRFITSREFMRTIKIPLPDLVVHLSAPTQPDQLFVTISAYEPVIGYQIIAVKGAMNGLEFSCPSSYCDVPISGDTVLDFWAVSSFGDESRHYQATIRELVTPDGKRLEISSINAIATFTDSCALAWGATLYQAPEWAQFPPSPEDLNTKKTYQYLAGQLLFRGIVKAPNCPGGGLASAATPNACGVDAASQTVIEWQNQFDVAIWDAARKVGVPPRIIKAILEQESQFWPGNSRIALYEYGLGQLSQAGADVVLRWDNDLFADICNGVLYNCGVVYGRLPSWMQATLRGGLLKALNAECATCANGIDLAKAHESIPIFTRTVRANCYQVNHVMKKHSAKASYEDMWRFTLLSYHSGYNCLDDALYLAQYNHKKTDWTNVAPLVKCSGGQAYVDNIFKSLNEFEPNRLIKPERKQPDSLPTFAPSPTPTRTPLPTATATPLPSKSHIRVMVFVDQNGNGTPETPERVNDLAVEVRFENGTVLTGTTRNGEADIDLTGQPVGLRGTVGLTGLFYTQRIRVPRDGEIPVIFRLEEPVLPPVLP